MMTFEQRTAACILIMSLLAGCCMPRVSNAANVHSGTTDPLTELQATLGDALVPFLVSPNCLPPVPSSSLTFAAFSCALYAKNTTNGWLSYVTQPANSLGPLNGGDGTYWLAMHRDLSTSVGGWSRQPGSHYLFQRSASLPATPNGALIFAKVTVAGGIITAIVPQATSSAARSPQMGMLYAADFGVTCDGATNISKRLQQVITLANQAGVALQLPSGSCLVRETLTVPTRSHILGAPGGELFWDTPIAGTHAVLNLVDATEVILEGIHIRSTNTTATVNPTFSNNYPIKLDHSSNNIIKNCHISAFWGEAGILLGPGSTATNRSDTNLIEGNILLSGSAYGIEISSGAYNRVIGNYLQDGHMGQNNAGTGNITQNLWSGNVQVGNLNTNLIAVIGGAPATGDVANSFIGNNFLNVRVSGQNFFSGTFASNIMIAATTAVVANNPISIQNSSGSFIKNNIVSASNYTAAFTSGTGVISCSSCADIIFEGNYIANAPNANGLALNLANRVTVRGNTITNNGANGIEVVGLSTDVMLTDNIIYDNNPGNNTAYFGINLDGNGSNVATRTVIKDNKVFSPAANKQSIPLNGDLDVESVIIHNVFYPRQATAAWTLTSSVNPHFFMNKIAAVSECGVFTLAGAATTTVTNANATTTKVALIPTNAAAGTLMGSAKSLFVSAVTPWTSFAVRTADNNAAAGTETFSYCLLGN